MYWIGVVVIGLHITEMLMQNLNEGFCTSKKILLIRILFTTTSIFYIATGHWISNQIVDQVDSHLSLGRENSIGQFQHNKFNGMDMDFLVNQIYFVKLVMLILLLSLISSLSEKFMNFIGVVQDRSQSCLLYTSLVEGRLTRFYPNPLDKNLYSRQLFSNFQFLTVYLHRVFEIFLPLVITLFVYFHIERSEASKNIHIDFRGSVKKVKQ